MDLKDDGQQKGATILDFRLAYVRKHKLGIEVVPLAERIRRLVSSDRAIERMLKDIKDGK